MKAIHYDAVIIGFGKGGKTLAGKLAMDLNVDYTVLRDQIFTYPTMS